VREKGWLMKIKKRTTDKFLQRSRKLRKESTPQEIILWSRIKNRQLKNLKFKRQYQIGTYIVDFICEEKKLIIELDGWQHSEQEEYDLERAKYLERQGYRVLRIWNGEINSNLIGVFLKLDEFL
jgi:very-short-patch-repair endonuclease